MQATMPCQHLAPQRGSSAGVRGMGVWRHALLGLMLVLGLSGCGFKLRGDVSLPFHSMAVNPQPGGVVAQALRRQLARTVRVLDAQTPLDQAELVLDVLDEKRAVGALSTTPSGQVTQVQLSLVVRFSVRTPQGQVVLAPVDMVLKQEGSYSESLALSKELEQDLMFRDMQQDVVQQILRRLSTMPARP